VHVVRRAATAEHERPPSATAGKRTHALASRAAAVVLARHACGDAATQTSAA